MSLCKGKCGKEAIFGNWCCEKYNNCKGYRKQLSDKAKLRGNNGVRGRLSKMILPNGLNNSDILKLDLICNICKKSFITTLKAVTVFRSSYKPLCKSCIIEKRIMGIKNRIENLPYKKLGYKKRKNICWEEQGEKCNICGYNQYPIENGPYQIHHKDGNKLNHYRENEEVLCANCHVMTDNHSFKNRKHTEEAKNMISQNNFMKKSKEKRMVEIAQR